MHAHVQAHDHVHVNIHVHVQVHVQVQVVCKKWGWGKPLIVIKRKQVSELRHGVSANVVKMLGFLLSVHLSGAQKMYENI